jgi:MFS family permease
VTILKTDPPLDPSISSASRESGRTAPRKIEGRFSTRKIIDMIFGALVMGTVGLLIGLLMGSGMTPVGAGIGIVLGIAVGIFGGRRFLVSILICTVAGGALAWALAGPETVSFGAGAGAAMGGFLGVWLSMMLDMWAERRRARTPSRSNPDTNDGVKVERYGK